jgi:hypothetical protein
MLPIYIPQNLNSSLTSKLVDDIVYEVDCQMQIVKEGEVDIGKNGFLLCDRVVRLDIAI